MNISVKYAIDDKVKTIAGDKGIVIGYVFQKQKGVTYIVVVGYDYKYLYDYEIIQKENPVSIGFNVE